jgi:molybdopterin/thiamine biosynthesis adenylyltransferase
MSDQQLMRYIRQILLDETDIEREHSLRNSPVPL